MDKILKKVKDIFQEGCVTIILNTHRTKPDYLKDSIQLKNLVKEAEDRLTGTFEKRVVRSIMEKLNRLVEKIDHSQNLESLIIFANQNFTDYTRLTISSENRVVIDQTFATRELVRAMHQQAAYYVLVLSRQKARLIEASNDKVVQELKRDFPLVNNLYTTDRARLSTNKGQDNLIEEFFNRVDKVVTETTRDHPLPLVLATENRNYEYYLKIADNKDLIIGYINRNRDDETAHDIVKDAWEEVLELAKKKNQARIDELHQAVGQNKFVSDYSEIWNAIQQGRGKTLFVKRRYYQPALIEGNKILLVDEIDKDQKGIVDDIIDEMIEQNLAFGGDTVFVEGNEIESFQNIALVTRY